MSFIATRFVLLLGQRAAFLQRLRKMRRDWLAEQPPILPVIALRAALSQAEALSSRYWLTGQSEVEARLDEAENLLSVVDQARQAHDRMQHEINTRVVRRRASLRLDQIVGEIGAGPLSQADVTRLKGRLDELKEWYGDQQQQEKRYWADLKPAIEALCAEVDVTAFEKIPEAKTAADTLLSDLRQTLDTEPAGLQGKNDAENNYGRLKILWEVHHHDEVVQQLTRSDLTKKPIDDVYMVVDNFWWERLKAEASKWELEEQGSDAAKHETYAIVTLTARALGDPALSSSYLVRKKLTWHWKITESSKFGFGVLSRGVTSTQPQIAQYATRPGKMAATVQVNYGGEEWPPAGQQPIALGTPITIRRSGDFRIWRFFEARDMISTLLALIVSVVSGLALYAFAPSFGTLKDYLALFTWAAGVDQGKNFLQSLAAYAPASKTTPVAGSPGA